MAADLRETRDMMMLSNAAYSTVQEINKSMKDGDPANNLLPPGWRVLEPHPESHSGFYGCAFVNDKTREVAIAFRGSEGTPGYMLVNGPDRYSNKDWEGPDRALGGGYGRDWDTQFTEALDFSKRIVERVREEYPGYETLATGHSLGGGITQIVSSGCGVRGVAFDPPGALNVVESSEFAAWKAKNPVNGGEGYGNVVSYCVNGSLASHAMGEHVGRVVPVSGNWPTYGDVTQQDRHDRHRLGDLFQDAYETGSLKKSDDRSFNDKLKHAPPQQGASFESTDPRLANLYERSLDGVQGLGAMGTPPRSKEQLAEMATNAAIGAGFDPAKPVEVVAARGGQSFFVVQGDPRDPASHRVAVNPDQPPPVATLPQEPANVAQERIRSQAMSM